MSSSSSSLHELNFSVLITDPRQTDNPIIFASSAFMELTGYSRSEIIGHNCRFLQGDDTERRQVMEIRDAMREERPCQVLMANYKKSGEKFWNQLYIEPVFNKEGLVYRYVGIQTDITSLIESQKSSDRAKVAINLTELLQGEQDRVSEVKKRLSESNDWVLEDQEVLSVLPSSISGSLERIQQSFVLVDPYLPDMPIVHAGSAFIELTGYPRNEIIGRNCRFLQGPQTDPNEVERIRRAVTTNPPKPVTATLLNYKYDGTPFWNALHISPVRGSDGEVAFLVGVQLNASEEANMEVKEDLLSRSDESRNDQNHVQNVLSKSHHRLGDDTVYVPHCEPIGLKHKILQNGTVGEVRVAIRSLSGSDRGLRRSLHDCKLPDSELHKQQQSNDSEEEGHN